MPPRSQRTEREKRKRKSRKTVISVWLSCRFRPFSAKKIFHSSFIFENFICAVPWEDNVIDLFKIFIPNDQIKTDTLISRSSGEGKPTKFSFAQGGEKAVCEKVR